MSRRVEVDDRLSAAHWIHKSPDLWVDKDRPATMIFRRDDGMWSAQCEGRVSKSIYRLDTESKFAINVAVVFVHMLAGVEKNEHQIELLLHGEKPRRRR
jgi:hypothetical protein